MGRVLLLRFDVNVKLSSFLYYNLLEKDMRSPGFSEKALLVHIINKDYLLRIEDANVECASREPPRLNPGYRLGRPVSYR